MLFIRKCMSPNKNAISCPCGHAVEGISDHLGIQVAVCCYNCLTKLSQIIWLLIMWHIPNSMLHVAPKKKIARGGQGQSPRLLISRCRQGNCPRRYRIVALLFVKISLIGCFFANFRKFWKCLLIFKPKYLGQNYVKIHMHGIYQNLSWPLLN
jgi:hypothetical protein